MLDGAKKKKNIFDKFSFEFFLEIKIGILFY